MRLGRDWSLVALLWLSASAAAAGPLAPQLIPIDPTFRDLGAMQPYFQALRQRLLGPHAPAGEFVLVTPSFKAEWALELAWDRGHPFVLLVKANPSLWYAVQQRAEEDHRTEAEVLPTVDVSVTHAAAPLSHDAARAAREAWSAMLQAAREPKDPGRGMDGTGYFFFAPRTNGKQRAGYAWSPKQGTATAALVELLEALRAHAEADPSSHATTEAAVVRLSGQVLRQAKAGVE